MPDPPSEKPEPPDKDASQSMWRQVGHYSHLGFILPACVLVGYFVGAGLDRWLHTSWIIVAGILLGCVAGFTELIREMLKASKES